GTLLVRELDRVEVMTPGGVAYEIAIPRSVYEKLPSVGGELELRTVQVVREDAVLLFGFAEETDRVVFTRLLTGPRVGPRLGLALLWARPARGRVRALSERDVNALTTAPGVGKKTAERLSLDLANRLDDIVVAATAPAAQGPAVEEA